MKLSQSSSAALENPAAPAVCILGQVPVSWWGTFSPHAAICPSRAASKRGPLLHRS